MGKGALMFRIAALAGAALGLAAPASAELVRANDSGFVTRHEVVVEATPKDVWLALIAPATWWRAEHTWSGDAKNLTLTPQAGGCFCETIPEVDEPGRFTLQGSVEHMRVVQAYPEQALRMTGALGPLQSEPVTGVLTIVISTVKQGTRIVLEYNVGGPMRYEVPVISKAVDGVMGAQLASLGKLLGPVAMPAPVAPSPAETAPADATAAPADAPEKAGAGASKAAPAAPAIKAAPVLGPATKPAASEPAPAPAAKPAAKVPSVEDAFADLDKDPAA